MTHLCRTHSFFALLALAAPAAAQCTYSWPTNFAAGCNDTVSALAVAANGDLIAGGRFVAAGAVAANRVARWNGTAWATLGTGTDGDVLALATLANGDLVAGGTFASAGGTTVNRLARWDGASWSAFGNGIDGSAPFGIAVQALAVRPNGELVVAGSFQSVSGVPAANIARWNGTTWSALGSGCNGTVRGLAVTGAGDVIATGSFLTAGGITTNGVARWNGTTWSALGSGLGVFGGTAVTVQPSGAIVVGGSFITAGGVPANRVARWNGTTWAALGAGLNGVPTSLQALPDGSLVAAGQFTTAGGVAANGIAKWNDVAWAPLAGGTTGLVHDLALLPSGAVVAGGDFTQAGGAAAARIAAAVSSCAPVVAAFGAGCTGTAGPNTLAVAQWPLLGGSLRARSSGMPSQALVLAVTGLTSINLPLTVALPQALPGCSLYANPDLIDVLLPAAGSATSNVPLGADPAVLGATLWHQHIAMDIDAFFNITALSSTNALQATLGTF